MQSSIEVRKLGKRYLLGELHRDRISERIAALSDPQAYAQAAQFADLLREGEMSFSTMNDRMSQLFNTESRQVPLPGAEPPDVR